MGGIRDNVRLYRISGKSGSVIDDDSEKCFSECVEDVVERVESLKEVETSSSVDCPSGIDASSRKKENPDSFAAIRRDWSEDS